MVGLVVILRDVIYMAPNNVEFIFPQMDQSHQPQLDPSPDTQPNPTKYGTPRKLWIPLDSNFLSMLKIETSVKEVQTYNTSRPIPRPPLMTQKEKLG